MCFQGKLWSNLGFFWNHATMSLRGWSPLHKVANLKLLDRSLWLLDFKLTELLRIAWKIGRLM